MSKKMLGLGLLLAFLLAGCANPKPSAESKFYRLSAPALADQESALQPSFIMVIGPLSFAEYLKRSAVVMQTGAHQFNVLKLDQWGGSLESEFQLALVKQLSAIRKDALFLRYPAYTRVQAASLKADVLTFDGMPGGEARLEVNWVVQSATAEILAMGRFSKVQKTENATLDALVKAQSQLVAQFAQSVASHLQSAEFDGNHKNH